MFDFLKSGRSGIEKEIADLVAVNNYDAALVKLKETHSSLSPREACDKLFIGLFAYSLSKQGIQEIKFEKDRKDYDQFMALVGSQPVRTPKWAVYLNEKDEIADGLTALIEKSFSKDNVLMQYFNELRKKANLSEKPYEENE